MLKGVSPLISPELLVTLARMGYGDESVLADAHFPGGTHNDFVIRTDGLRIDRFEFSARTEEAFAVVMTGETSKYGIIILKKGVTP